MAQQGSPDEDAPVMREHPMRSRRVKLAAAGLFALVGVGVIAGLVSSGDDPQTQAAANIGRPGIVASASTEPAGSAEPSATSAAGSSATPAATVAGAGPVFPTSETPSGAPSQTPVALSTAAAPDPTTQPTATPTPAIGGGAAVTPAASTPVPAGTLSAAALEIVRQTEETFGVRVVLDGQSWGGNEAEQVRNLTAVGTALDRIPDVVASEVANSEGGVLAFLSNGFGRTEDGWQPYGNRAANFYTNEDQGPGGSRAANQIVLQPGSSAQTIAHELAHAYQMRTVAPGDYVKALLTDEMKSFMATTGWSQLVSDAVVLSNSFRSWEEINAMYAYEGRPLTYLDEHGTVVNLHAPNPLEAYAEAAGLYYARSVATELPGWPELWGWFDAHLGTP